MHYYSRNIGDYHKKAGRLNMLQHGAYTLIMDSIYDREKFPTIEEAIDWVWASSKDEIDAITFVLNKFFTLEDGVYMQPRMADELQEYAGKCLTNGINGKKGGRPKGAKNKPKETQSVNLKTQSVNLETESKPNESDSKPNHKPLTINQEPITKNHEDQNTSAGSTEKAVLKKAISDNFDLFYSAFPKKTNKQEARNKFEIRCRKCKTTQDVWQVTEFLMLDVQERLDTGHWLTDDANKGFIPNAARYLLRELWNDEITPRNSNGPNQQAFAGRQTKSESNFAKCREILGRPDAEPEPESSGQTYEAYSASLGQDGAIVSRQVD